MKAMYTEVGLALFFSVGENFVGIALLESLCDMYEANGIDAQPIRDVIHAMHSEEFAPRTMQ